MKRTGPGKKYHNDLGLFLTLFERQVVPQSLFLIRGHTGYEVAHKDGKSIYIT